MVKVITYGTYDLLHYGHIRLLERAKALGDYLIVAVTSDDYDKSRGKINNQQSLAERIAAVKATGIADEILVEEYEGQKIDDIRRYEIDIFTVGSDWEGKFDYLKEYCKVIYLPRTDGISSSAIRADKRKIKIGTIGDENLCKKFIREMECVNGVEYLDLDLDNPVEEMDAVYIATHPSNRYADIKKYLNAGKHVICESPIALSHKQCEELMTLAHKKDLVLCNAIKTAYSTAYARLLVIAKSGRIGDIISVDASCTSLADGIDERGIDLRKRQNSICAWGPTALLPIFQLLGTDYRSISIATRIIDEEVNYDGFTKIDFVFDRAVASVKIAKGAKTEGELVVTGTKGYIYVPAPWWKTDYFEVRFENSSENIRHFYQLDGEGIRYEIVYFVKEVECGKPNAYISEEISKKIVDVIEMFNNKEYIEI